MEGIVGFEGRNDEDEITSEVKFSKLKQLELEDLSNLLSFNAQKEKMGTTMGSSSACARPLFTEKVIFPVLERLTIDRLGNIINIWDKQSIAVLEEQGPFCQLTDLKVRRCSKLMHVFPSNMHPLLKNLKSLEVEECETMEGIAEFEGEIDEDGLRNEIEECDELEEIFSKDPKEEKEAINDDIIVFPRLQEVKLQKLPKLKSFYTETQGFFSHKIAFPVLETLDLWGLNKITRIWDNQPLSEPEKKAKSFCELASITVLDCNQLEYVLPFYMLPQLKNILQNLRIWNCRKMEVIISKNPKEKEATNNSDTIWFPQLKQVHLSRLPNLKSFICSDETQLLFSNKIAFPVLETLDIEDLDKITRIWDNQPLLEPEKEAKSFCELMVIEVGGCNELEYVLPFYMLPQLKNLQELRIRSCSKMEVIISNNPKEKEATNNNDTIRFSQLKKVALLWLPNLKSFICSDETQLLFSNKIAFPVLETLDIGNLDKITRIWDNQPLSEPEKEAKSFCELMVIEVGGCNQLEYVLPFYMFSQLKNLQDLRIGSCSKMEVIISNNLKEKEAINNNDTIRLPQLKTLELKDLPNFKSFIRSHETQLFFSNKVIFPVLKKLSIRKMHKIIEIWDKQSIAVLEEEGSFCQLTDLDVSECEKLMHVFPSKMHSLLKNLKVLRVSDCPTIEGIVEFEGEIDEDGLRNKVCFGELSSLELSDLPNLESFCTKLGNAGTTEGNSTIHALPLFNGKVIFPMLKKLSIRKVHKIIEIWDKQSIAIIEEQGFFCQLTDLDVSECEKLMHVFPSKMHSPLKNLKVLRVSGCPTMKGIVEFEGEIDEDGLRKEVCFSKLNSLELSSLPNLVSFCTKLGNAGTTEGNSTIHALPLFNGKVAFPVLETLKFKDLNKITRIWDHQPLSEPEKEAKSFCKLMVIKVEDCDQLEYVLPLYVLPQLKNLQNLTISGSTKMEVIISNNQKEKEATNNDIIRLPLLKEVELEELPNLKSFVCSETQLFFSNKVIFPVLKKLSIRKVHKIIEIWDKQSIAVLEEQGSFCQLMDLDVSECEKLMHVFPSKIHSPLKNLEVLRVSDCPTMEGIVEFEEEIDEDGLRNKVCFSELSSLELSNLPNLESFCTKLGKAGTTEGNSTIHAQPLFNGKVAFPALERLSFRNLDKITSIWDEQPLSEQEKEAKFFCELGNISVDGCNQLEYVFPFYMLPQLKNLGQLWIQECRKMEVIISNNPKEKEATNNNDTIRLPLLKNLHLKDLPTLKSFICSDETQLLFSNKVAFPVLKSLSFRNLDSITRIWDEQPLSEQEKDAKSFCELGNIFVDGCNQLEYVLPIYMLPQLKNLGQLWIQGCRKMEVIISNNPKEKEATNNNDTIRFPLLKEVGLEELPNLKSFICSDETQLLFSKVAFPALESLSFRNLDSITRIWDEQPLSEQEKDAKSFCELGKIFVDGCNQLEYVFPVYMLPQLKNLGQLRIQGCRKTEVIISNNPKEKEATNNNDTIRLPLLKEVELEELPNLKSFICSDETQLLFSNKVAFPVLESLSFRNLDSITRIWDEQPLSEQEKDAKSFCELGNIFVDGCNQLEYVFPVYMLPQLKNLRQLWIQGCRKMEVIISNNPKEKEATNNNDINRFPLLKEVELEELPNLKSFIYSDETQLLFSNKVAFPVLERLSFRNLHKITRIWDEQPLSEQEKEAKSFYELGNISVDGCNQLEYVFPFYMLPQLKNLGYLMIQGCRKMEVIISNNPKEKEATNNNNTIRFPLLKNLKLKDLPNLKSFICSDETQLLFSNKDTFPVLKRIHLGKDLEFFRNETSTKEVSIEEWSTSNEESDYNSEELDEDLETPVKEECSTSGKGNDHNGAELDKDLETPTKNVSMEECGTSGPSGKENDHNGEQG